MEEKVREVLEKIKPALQADGGDIELIEVKDGVVKVKLKGACGTCPMAQLTLKNFVENILKKNISEIKRVEAV